MGLVDSHCHIDFPNFAEQRDELLVNAAKAGVEYMLCVAVNLEDYPNVLELARNHENLFASVGVHPNTTEGEDPSVARLVELGSDADVIAIGETGLDYFRSSGDLDWQRQRFIRHIQAARELQKPIIVHSRNAPEDTIKILRDANASEASGVMHCFTGDYEMAKASLDMGFYISFSGIVTFRNATDLAEVSKKIPLDRILVETDAPYLAPVPMRGKENQPAFVRHTAEFLAGLRNLPFNEFAATTTENFFRLFSTAKPA